MTFRNFNVVAHRWMGLVSSLVIIVAGLTGVLLVWSVDPPWGEIIAHWHVSMYLGAPGAWIVLVATWVSVILIVSGLYLWWRTKTFRIRTKSGWRAFVIDLHFSLGVFSLLMTLLIALTGALRPALPQSRTRDIVSRLHTAARFPQPIKVAYAVGSMVFVVEGVTGVVMWMAKQGRGRRRANP